MAGLPAHHAVIRSWIESPNNVLESEAILIVAAQDQNYHQRHSTLQTNEKRLRCGGGAACLQLLTIRPECSPTVIASSLTRSLHESERSLVDFHRQHRRRRASDAALHQARPGSRYPGELVPAKNGRPSPPGRTVAARGMTDQRRASHRRATPWNVDRKRCPVSGETQDLCLTAVTLRNRTHKCQTKPAAVRDIAHRRLDSAKGLE